MNTDLFGIPLTEAKPSSGLGRRDHLTFRGNVSLGRHGWLRLTPAYSLHLVRKLLEQSGPNELVLEPFSGTGTTPLACSAFGIRCHAVDINPFLVWLGNLKLAKFDEGTAEAVVAASRRVSKHAVKMKAQAWRPDLHQIEKWWEPRTLEVLASLCDGIRTVRREHATGVTGLLYIAFCRVMIQSASVSFGHQSMSFRKRRDDAPLVDERAEDVSAHVVQSFANVARDVADSLSVEPPIAECQVLLGDSRDLPSAVAGPGERYTLVITSPPYPNRMSYIRELRPYMYWLGHLSDGRAAGELDWKAIGGTWGCATSMLNTWKPADDDKIPYRNFDRIVHDIGAGHPLLGRYVHRYFEDIKSHIVGLRKVLAEGARCHYIVGNSKFYDTILPVEEIYAALFEDAGFVGVSIETIRKRTSKKELFEFVVHAKTKVGARIPR